MDALGYLDFVCIVHEELTDWCDTLKDLYKSKLWHELTVELEQFFRLPTSQTGVGHIELYDNFIIHFETKINPLKLAHFAVTVSNQYSDKEAGLNYLKGIIEKLQSANQMHIEGPILFINTQIALLNLGKGDHKECKNLLDSGNTTLDSMTDIDESVYVYYYWVSCKYHRFHLDPVEFYKNGILFLAYVSLESLPDSHKLNFAFNISVSAMLGDNIYNCGELLAHPIIKSLLGSPYEWIYHMLEAFSSGNLVRYQELCRVHKTRLHPAAPLLLENEKIVEKINILWLMEFIFRRSSKDRTIPLAIIAEQMKLTVKDVEHLLLKSLSVHLIEGMIDEVDGTVHVSWVQPGVLGLTQITYLRHRLANWLGKVQWVIISVETGTPEFVAL